MQLSLLDQSAGCARMTRNPERAFAASPLFDLRTDRRPSGNNPAIHFKSIELLG